MKAQYKTKCSACNKNHINPGDDITKYGYAWAAKECVDGKFDILKAEQRIKYDMLDKYNVCSEGKTNQEFFYLALEKDVCSQLEYEELSRKFGPDWNKELSD